MIRSWKLLKSAIVFDHKWYTLRQDTVQLPDDHIMDDYFVSVRPEIVVMFALTEDQHVLMVKQYKHGVQKILMEFPGGAVDKEDPDFLSAAKRELLEETGYSSDKWNFLSSVYHNPTKDTNNIHFFIAENAKQTASPKLDISEEIEVLKIPVSELKPKLLNGEIDVCGSIAIGFLGLNHLEKNSKSKL